MLLRGLAESFQTGNFLGAIFLVLKQLIIVLIALTVHEVAHGFVALKLGDDTAKRMGRLSLNPLRHLDPVGFICMLLCGFGWANPVPIRAGRFKNPRLGMAISALAGPVSNILMAFVALVFYSVIAILTFFFSFGAFADNLIVQLMDFLAIFHVINLSFAVFNFIPVPPLDGSRILYSFLPDKLYFGVMKYERYISMALMILLIAGVLDKPMDIAVSTISNGMSYIIGGVAKIFI